VTEDIRQELQSVVVVTTSSREDKKDEAKLGIMSLESQCPFPVSSYRETIRLVNSQVSFRRVMTDTVLSDGKSFCLLRAGSDLQLLSGVTHLSTEILGSNAAEFDIKRLLKLESNISLGDAAKDAEPE
jgi:cytochrome P450